MRIMNFVFLIVFTVFNVAARAPQRHRPGPDMETILIVGFILLIVIAIARRGRGRHDGMELEKEIWKRRK